MWLAPIAQLLALSAMASQPATASPVSTPALPEPIATRQTFFGIPFRIDPAEQAWRDPVEVQLFVSGNRGASWDLYSKVEPARRRFMFRAGADGEFWFLVRTLDRSGQAWPRGPAAPEMRVVVDTMPPKLELDARQGQAGQITTRWKIDDPNPKPDSLVIQYRTTAAGPWREVAVDRESPATPGSPQTGRVIWWPKDGSNEIQIRAEVSDTAGNLAVSHAQVNPGQGGSGHPDRTAQKASSPWRLSDSGGDVTARSRRKSTDDVGVDDPDDLAVNRDDVAGRQANSVQIGPVTKGHGDVESGHASQDDRSSGYAFQPNAGQPYPDTGASQPLYPHTGADAPLLGVGRDGLDRPAGSLVSSINPPIQNRYVSPGEPRGNPSENSLVAGPRPRMVNSRTFYLEYDAASVGASIISAVELWSTQDGGRSWERLTQDDDNRSPLLVKVDREGIYGLKVVATGGGGSGGQRPRPGELPQLVVNVDLTKPTARITASRQGAGAKSGNLIICWKADDKQLAARPVSLLLSERPAGPWTPIASGLENTGRYDWAIDDRAPQAVYLRLEVRDEAGNVGVSESTEPVSLTRFRPTVQARGARSAGGSERTPAKRYRLQ